MSKFLLSVCSCCFVIVGCGPSGPPLGEVTGTVMVDGKPAPGVDVMFAPVDGGRSSSGVTDDSGHYELAYSTSGAGAVIGSHNVVIRNAPPADMNDPDAPMVPTGVVTPEYAKMKKTVDVKSGDNQIDLDYP